MPSVAVAVVSWNTRDLLRGCLRSLEPEHAAGRAELWVVDNGSTDGSPEMVAAEFPWVRLHADGRNRGFGAAVNLVAARSDAPWIAPANADVELRPGALAALLAAGERDARAGAVAPRLILPGGRTQHSVYPFPTLPLLLAFNLGVHRLSRGLGDRLTLEGFWDPARPRTVDWAIAAFMLVRRRAFEEIGGFAEWQWMYAEDLDLGWRLARAGWTTRYEPRAEVGHAAGSSTQQAWGHDGRTERWQRATYAWMLRRRGVLRTRAAATINLAGAAGRVALLAPAAAVRPERFRAPVRANVAWMRLHRAGWEPAERLLAHR